MIKYLSSKIEKYHLMMIKLFGIRFNYEGNKQELLKKIKILQLEVDRIEREENKIQLAEKKFLELINSGLIISIYVEENITRYNNSKGKWVIEIDYKNEQVLFNYCRFWSDFEIILGYDDQKIREFLGGMVEKHLKLQMFFIKKI